MKRLFTGIVLVLVAAVLGLGSAFWAVRSGGLGTVRNGAWTTNLAIGSTGADPYTRARVALFGLFALNRSETVYFDAMRDDAGEALRSACVYKISGTSLPARWWSITAYAPDQFLIANPAGRYSFNMKSVEPDESGAFSFTAAGSEQPGRWLPTGQDRFLLTLRLYNPAPEVVEHPDRLELPRIARQGDCP
jgi:hypothetical protein